MLASSRNLMPPVSRAAWDETGPVAAGEGRPKSDGPSRDTPRRQTYPRPEFHPLNQPLRIAMTASSPRVSSARSHPLRKYSQAYPRDPLVRHACAPPSHTSPNPQPNPFRKPRPPRTCNPGYRHAGHSVFGNIPSSSAPGTRALRTSSMRFLVCAAPRVAADARGGGVDNGTAVRWRASGRRAN